MSLLIKNGTILTAASEFTGDIYIEGEIIRQIGTNLSVNASQTIDASGKYVMPGGVDEHVHYGSFGGRLFETAEAAAAGGTTTIVDFAPRKRAYRFWTPYGGRQPRQNTLPLWTLHSMQSSWTQRSLYSRKSGICRRWVWPH